MNEYLIRHFFGVLYTEDFDLQRPNHSFKAESNALSFHGNCWLLVLAGSYGFGRQLFIKK
jgi:hypothetical protein